MDELLDFIPIKTERILRLRGVFIGDLTNIIQLHEQNIQEHIQHEFSEKIVEYEPLPSMFKDITSWVKNTNLCCWNCDLQFSGIPCFIPKSIEPTVNGEIINVYGCFCWFNCAKSHINKSDDPTYIKIDRYNMLLKLYKKFTGTDVNDIPDAPNKYDMCKYGGSMTETEYRSHLYTLKLSSS